MNSLSRTALVSLLLLTGCAQKNVVSKTVNALPFNEKLEQATTTAETPSDVSHVPAQTEVPSKQDYTGTEGNITQCRKELESMRLYSEQSYKSFLGEFRRVGEKTDKYLKVKDSLGSDINDLVLPRYQFQIREVCFRIKTRLAQLLIRQAD